MQAQYGWRSCHYLPSLVCIAMGFAVLFLMKSPKELNTEVPGKESNLTAHKEAKVLSLRELWAIPMVPEVCGFVMCILVIKTRIEISVIIY